MSNEEIVERIQKGTDVAASQEGFIGLLTAAVRYDKNRRANFLTCAGYYIKAAVIRYSENCCTSVRMPVYLKRRIRTYARFRQQCMDEKGRYPTRDELLEGLDISERSLDHLEKTMYNMKDVSIDKDYTDGDGESSLIGMLQSDEEITYSIYSRDLKKALDSALAVLDAQTVRAVRAFIIREIR